MESPTKIFPHLLQFDLRAVYIQRPGLYHTTARGLLLRKKQQKTAHFMVVRKTFDTAQATVVAEIPHRYLCSSPERDNRRKAAHILLL